MFSFFRNLLQIEEKTATSNFELFLASPEYSRFQQEFPDIDFKHPVVNPEQLVIDEAYLMVRSIPFWDDISNDHTCRMEYDITNGVLYKGVKGMIYEFVDGDGENVYEAIFSYPNYFFYALNTHSIK